MSEKITDVIEGLDLSKLPTNEAKEYVRRVKELFDGEIK